MIKNKQMNSDKVLVRLCKKVILILLVIGIPFIYFIVTFQIEEVEVVGTNRYTTEQMKEIIFKTKPDNYSLYLYLKYRFLEQPKLPFVEKIDIDMVNSHSVKIYVYEKMVAGCIEFMGDYLYFDKDGIVVESTSEKFGNVPVIKGLQYKQIVLNEKLSVEKEEVFDVIINLMQLIHKYELAVDSISFNHNYEVTFQCGEVTVLLGKKSSYDEPLAELRNILKEAEGMKITLNMKDYEYGVDSIIAKEKKSTE